MGAPATQSLDGDSSHGDMEYHLMGGKEPELVQEVERYRLEIVGLTSTPVLGIVTLESSSLGYSDTIN